MGVHERQVFEGAVVMTPHGNAVVDPAVAVRTRLILAIDVVRDPPTFGAMQDKHALRTGNIEIAVVVETDGVNFTLSNTLEIKRKDRVWGYGVVELDHLGGVAHHVERCAVSFHP